MKTREAVNYSYALYLDQFRVPTSPNEMPDGYWEAILKEDRMEFAQKLSRPEYGLLKQVGENVKGNPIYVLTEKGDKVSAKYLRKSYAEEVKHMDHDSQFEIKEIAKWFGGAVIAGVVENRADAIFVELVQTALEISKLIITSTYEPETETVTVRSSN